MENLTSPEMQGHRIQKLRKMTFLSRSAFAEKHNLNLSSLQAWEDGRYKNGITSKTANKLLIIFAKENIFFDIEWLLHGIGNYPSRNFFDEFEPESSHKIKNELLEEAEKNKLRVQKNFELIEAIKKRKLQSIKLLINQGANLHKSKDKDLRLYGSREDTALHIAASHGNQEIVKFFLEIGLHPNIRNRHLDTPLHLCSYESNIEALKTLIENDANVDSGSREGATPLMWAAYMGHEECCKILIDAGARVNNTDINGNTAAHWACFNNKSNSLKLLIERGASPNIANHSGNKPIDWAIKNGHREALLFLINEMEL